MKRVAITLTVVLAVTACSGRGRHASAPATTTTVASGASSSLPRLATPRLTCPDALRSLQYVIQPTRAQPRHSATAAVEQARPDQFGSGAAMSVVLARVVSRIDFATLGYPRAIPRLMWVVEYRHGTHHRDPRSQLLPDPVMVYDGIMFVDDASFMRVGAIACPAGAAS
jgi:hypothetical protein